MSYHSVDVPDKPPVHVVSYHSEDIPVASYHSEDEKLHYKPPVPVASHHSEDGKPYYKHEEDEHGREAALQGI
jgi:hypothetical protein